MSEGASRVLRWLLTAGVAAALAGLAVVAGLRAASGRRDCTLIGSSPSGVSLVLPGVAWSTTEFCVDDECERGARVDVGTKPGVHSFRAAVVDPAGRPAEFSGEVTTFVFWPNGEGCGSRRVYGTVSISRDGTVTTLAPGPASDAR